MSSKQGSKNADEHQGASEQNAVSTVFTPSKQDPSSHEEATTNIIAVLPFKCIRINVNILINKPLSQIWRNFNYSKKTNAHSGTFSFMKSFILVKRSI